MEKKNCRRKLKIDNSLYAGKLLEAEMEQLMFLQALLDYQKAVRHEKMAKRIIQRKSYKQYIV